MKASLRIVSIVFHKTSLQLLSKKVIMNSLEFPKRSVSRMNQIQPNLLQSKMLPVGIENFEEIRTEGYYYIDKAGTIKSLLTKRSKLLFRTRPRRFGKSLNINMLKSFLKSDAILPCLQDLRFQNSAICVKNTWGIFLWFPSV